MYKEFLLLLIIYFCLISNSYSADYEKGLAAARSGDFFKAIKRTESKNIILFKW